MLTKIDENTTAWGQLTIVKTDGITGETTTQVVPNIITTVGKTYIAQRMRGSGTTAQVTAMSNMAIGTNNTATNVADTTLNTEVAVSVYVGGAVRPTITLPTGSANVLTYVCTFGPQTGAGTVGIQEAGIFDSATRNAGNMLCRTVFGVVTKTALDTVTITWTVTIN